MIRKLHTKYGRGGFSSSHNKTGYDIMYYYPKNDRSKKVRHTLVFRSKKKGPIFVLHGREIASLQNVFERAAKDIREAENFDLF